MSNWLHYAAHAAHDKKNPKLSGVVLIVIGLCLAPFIIGIPIMAWGFYKLLS